VRPKRSADLRFSCSPDCRRLISASRGNPAQLRALGERGKTGDRCRITVSRLSRGSKFDESEGAANVDAHPYGLQLDRRHPAARDPTKDGTSSKGRQRRNGGTATPSCWREPAPTCCRTGAAQLVGAAAFEPVTRERSLTEPSPVLRSASGRRYGPGMARSDLRRGRLRRGRRQLAGRSRPLSALGVAALDASKAALSEHSRVFPQHLPGQHRRRSAAATLTQCGLGLLRHPSLNPRLNG
jgi:hypothetical protein